MLLHPSVRTLVLFAAAASFAATRSPAAEVKGTVRTDTGTPVAQVVVRLAGAATTSEAVTGAGGEFKLDLPEGTYITSVRGFDVDATPVVVGKQSLDLSISLRPASVREEVIVAATRSATPISSVGVSASVLDSTRLRERQTLRLTDALAELPGMSVATTGGVGAQSSLFVRGGESRFARVLIDGVPVNEPGGFFNFGTLLTPDIERVEVVRGSFGTLYGSDALAGVIALETIPTDAARRFRADVGGGDLGTRSISGRASEKRGPLSASLALGRSQTDNVGMNGDFTSTLLAASIDRRMGTEGFVRGTFRLNTSEGGTPGPTVFGRPDRDARYERDLAVASLSSQFRTGSVRQAVRAGFKRDDQVSKDPLDSGSYRPAYGALRAAFNSSDFPNPRGFRNHTDRWFGTYEARSQVRSHFVTAGGDLERETGQLGNVGDVYLAPKRTSYGVFVQDQLSLSSRAFTTMSLRAEHNGSTGTTLVPHLSAAWIVFRDANVGVTVRGSGGAGIKAPSFFESYGTSSFALGNPDLQPERARTYDAGVDLRVGDTLKIQGTYFHHTYLDQIAYKIISFAPFRGTYENLGETRVRGFEFVGEWRPSAHVRFTSNYTRQDSEIVTSTSTDPALAAGRELRRRPKNQGSVTAEAAFGPATVAGTLLKVGSRADSDFLGIGLDRNPGFTRLDLRAAFRAAAHVTILAALENATDEAYQEALGYAGLPRRFRISIFLDSMR